MKNFILFAMLCVAILEHPLSGHLYAGTTRPEDHQPKIELVYAKYAYVDITGSWPGQSVFGDILVSNSSMNKNVFVHYSFNLIDWLDIKASFKRSLADGRELWSFAIPAGTLTPRHFYFVLGYEAKGIEVWDNNRGKNFFINGPEIAQLGNTYGTTAIFGLKNIILQEATRLRYNPELLCGALHLKNLAYEKDVKILYSTDKWKTYQEESAHFKTMRGQDETWDFCLRNLDENEGPVQFAIKYKTDGNVYWDDQFGANYSLDTGDFFRLE